MRLGFYGNYTKSTIDFAQRIGFKSMELSAWPQSALNADKVTTQQIEDVQKNMEARDLQISSLGYYPNYLTPDKAAAEEAARYFIKVLDLALSLGVPNVSTFIGRDPDKSVEENLPAFKEVFSRFVDAADKRNINIAIENCPMMNYRSLKSENIAYSPEIWEVLFDMIPAHNFGIELDPAHMVWQGIDYIQAIRDFGNRIFHVHAKDMEIRHDVLARCGIYGLLFEDVKGLGHGWWRGRAPGFGEVKWSALVTALLEVGYKGNIDIEHEDDVLCAAARMGAVKEEADIVNSYCTEPNGLIMGYNTLCKLIPSQ